MAKVMAREAREAWIVEWLVRWSKPIGRPVPVDTLNTEFVDDYCEATGATPTYMLIGANKCELLRADLRRMHDKGTLSRYVAGISGMSGMGFPKHIPSYALKVLPP